MNKVLVVTLLLLGSVEAFAEACTYQEALMALESGNYKRAETLMQMAAHDGDQRAVVFLKSKLIGEDLKVIAIASAETGKSIISLP